jgi:hypothetical protein
MGRHKKVKEEAKTEEKVPKGPRSKYEQVIKIADKNSYTISKISTLLEVMNRPGAAELDPEGHMAKRCGKGFHHSSPVAMQADLFCRQVRAESNEVEPTNHPLRMLGRSELARRAETFDFSVRKLASHGSLVH